MYKAIRRRIDARSDLLAATGSRIRIRIYEVIYCSQPDQHLSLTFFKKNQSKFTPLLSKITLRL